MKKKYPYILSYASLLLNVGYLSLWTYVFEKYNDHSERIDFFKKFIPFNYIELLMIPLSVYSIIVFARSRSVINKVCLLLQIGITLLLLWQFL